jgi:proline iminopeptidase
MHQKTSPLDAVLFPEIEPYDRGHIPVGDGHALYYEQCGNPAGVPLVFLHGGPGAGFRPSSRRYYDPAFWRIVLFDQRGAGKSTPYASIHANTTPHLVADVERVRVALNIERWAIAGGSWGSFLALAAAQAAPERCLALLLRGVFLGRKAERVWWWEDGTRWLFPDRWTALRDFLPEAERGRMLESYYRRLTDPDPAVHLPAAVALRTYSGWTVSFRPNEDYVRDVAEPQAALTLARMFTHYCMNAMFVPEDALMAAIGRIAHIEGVIVQGRYDVVTPARAAFELAQAWPNAELTVVNDGGHSIDEPDMARAMIAGQERLKAFVGGG